MPAMAVDPALRALAEGLVDYAGLFPPAVLPMDTAWREYGRHRRSAEAWMLGRFICPATHLPELRAGVTTADGELPLLLLANRAPTAEALTQSLQADASAWVAFQAAFPGRATAQAWELRLPADAPGGTSWARRLDDWAACLPAGADLCWEPDPAWDAARLQDLASALAARGDGRWGLKLRCGGVTAAEFPSVERVALVLALARDLGLPLKFTAGLHHPLRHWRPELGAWMHGFLNVYAAALAAQVHGLCARDLRPLLEETRRDAFRLVAHELRWRELRFCAREIQEARRLLPGHGSCSFDEPVADLRALGWLPPA